MTKQKRFILQEKDLPTKWYNIQAEMPNKPLPPLNPATKEPLKAEDLAHIFSLECSKQELDTEHAWIDIPEPVLDMYKYYRSTPLVRAYASKRSSTHPHISTSRTRVSTRSVRTRSTRRCRSAITASRRAPPMSPQRREPDSGVRH